MFKVMFLTTLDKIYLFQLGFPEPRIKETEGHRYYGLVDRITSRPFRLMFVFSTTRCGVRVTPVFRSAVQ